MIFSTGAELFDICKENNITISEAAVRYELEIGERTRGEIYSEMRLNLKTMKDSIKQGISSKHVSVSGLVSDDANTLLEFAPESVMGENLTKIVASAMAVTEVNATMGRIVAAPTAGASGILPGVLIEYAHQRRLDDEMLLKALFNASAIGVIIAKNASIAGASGGCQAETGSASAMTASALVEMRGGTVAQSLDAAAMTLKNVMGLVCDPVAGLVECPCIKRNALGAVNAVLCSDMALSGIKSIIPFDEVVISMRNVGRMMHPDLRETAKGGLAATPTGLKIAEQMAKEKYDLAKNSKRD
ncbi:MAG: L-serine ammonia-lyase, iron-sulfur-dependent, subunit alpha [Clostridia bacterium]|nr:L-serine ammonia-lyase, iron-sulfur-dependent, subunit alpha [Clostridia bacterium]